MVTDNSLRVLRIDFVDVATWQVLIPAMQKNYPVIYLDLKLQFLIQINEKEMFKLKEQVD
jgi:hypothetical protein